MSQFRYCDNQVGTTYICRLTNVECVAKPIDRDFTGPIEAIKKASTCPPYVYRGKTGKIVRETFKNIL